MSKAGNITLAIIVFLLAWLLCTVTFMGTDASSYAWAIGLIIALVIGVGSYYFFGVLQKRTFAQEEKTAKEIFTPVLPAGERLLAFAQCYTGPGRTGMVLLFGALGDAIINAPRRKWYYLGITQQYLILVQVNGRKPTGVQQVLRRGEVGQLEFETGAFKEPKLILQFTAERMELRVEGNMIKRAKAVDVAWRGAA